MTLEHIEDEVLNGGVSGTRGAINFLQSLRDMLAGHSESKVNLTTKWDGCLDGSTQVVTNEGVMTLAEIRQKWHTNKELWILAKDEELNTDCFVPITQSYATKSKKDWVKITLGNGHNIICTEDHEIKTTNRGWVEAVNLNENDEIEECDILNMDEDHLYLRIDNENIQIRRKNTP